MVSMDRRRLQYFGRFTVRENGQEIIISSKPARWLLALLGTDPSREWPRREVAALLWPDVEGEVSANRLRVSLARLKEAVGEDAIVAGKATLRLAPDKFDTDLAAMEQLERASHLAAVASEELRLVMDLHGTVSEEFLAGWDALWVDEHRYRWEGVRREASARAATLAFRLEDYELAAELAGEALAVDESDASMWATYLRASAKQGRSHEALAHFSVARKRLKEQGFDEFPASLRELVRTVQDGHLGPDAPRRTLRPEVAELLLEVICATLDDAPELLIPLLISPKMRHETYGHPEIAVEILQEVFDRTEGHSEDRCKLALHAMRAHTALNRTDPIIELGEWVFDNSIDPRERCTAKAQRAFAYFIKRDYEAAFRDAEIAIEVARESGDKYIEMVAEVQKASFTWHQGRLEDALELYKIPRAYFQQSSDPLAPFNALSTVANSGFIYYFLQDFARSAEVLEDAITHARIVGFPTLIMMAGFYYGYDLHRIGRTAEGVRHCSASLTAAYRAGQWRNIQIGLDIVARFLLDFGHASAALGLLDANERYRLAHEHVWSVAEMTVVDEIRQRAGKVAPSSAWSSLTEARPLVVAAVEALRPYAGR